MEGEAKLPAVSDQGGGAAYCTSSGCSSAVTATTLLQPINSVSVTSSRESFNNKPSSGKSCVCHESVVSPSDEVTFGPPPSRLEVEKAMTDLQRFLQGEAKSDIHWLQPVVHPGDPRIHNAFNMLQREPSVQNLVASLSCDKAVWDAMLNNREVQNLRGSNAAGERRQASTEEADIASLILNWILGYTKSKVGDLIEKIVALMAELFLPGDEEKPTSELTDLVQETIRSSLLLSVVILLIVIVTRNNGT